MSTMFRTRGYANVEVVHLDSNGDFKSDTVRVDGNFTSESGINKAVKSKIGEDNYIVRSIENHRVKYGAPEEEFWKIAKEIPNSDEIVPLAERSGEDKKNNKQ